jgi:Kef-type K+ transport system membrane component KefB
MEIGFESSFVQITILLLLAALLGAVAHALRQPLILAFIVVGILASPAGFGLVEAAEPVGLLAHLGITLLLFLVGLKLDINIIRRMGKVSLATGLGQVAFTSIVGFLIALGLGLDPLSAVYVAVALTFSSTIIIVKLLSDKKEIDALHGRIAVGFLIVQDLVVILALITLSAMGASENDVFEWMKVFAIFGRGLLFLGAVGLVAKFVLPHLLIRLARSNELLILFAIAWAVSLSLVSELIGMSGEVGAFLAGVSIASSHFRDAIGGRLVALRDFLLLFFFISLGSQLDLELLGARATEAIVLSVFVLIGNPLIVILIMGLLGYRARTGFLAGLTVAQISEFSLIFAAMGVSLSHLAPDILGLVTMVGVITIGISTYMILFSHPIYEKFSKFLRIFERKKLTQLESEPQDKHQELPEIILLGLGRYGTAIGYRLYDKGKRVLGVDFDPEVIHLWQEKGARAQYGDAEDPELLHHLPFSEAKWVVSTIPDFATSISVAKELRDAGFKGKIAVTTHHERDASDLVNLNLDKIFLPYSDAADEAANFLLK